MKDIFGREVKAGDKVAVGMAMGRSSVLRIGEVIYVGEKDDTYRAGETKWTVRIRWTHNGSRNRNSYYDVSESNIRGESSYNYAKLVILPEGFVDEFPPDVI